MLEYIIRYVHYVLLINFYILYLIITQSYYSEEYQWITNFKSAMKSLRKKRKDTRSSIRSLPVCLLCLWRRLFWFLLTYSLGSWWNNLTLAFDTLICNAFIKHDIFRKKYVVFFIFDRLFNLHEISVKYRLFKFFKLEFKLI